MQSLGGQWRNFVESEIDLDFDCKYKTFRKLCGARVYEILGGTATVEFILWSHYFFKRIHGDIATYFQVDTCKNVSVDDYEQAKALASE